MQNLNKEAKTVRHRRVFGTISIGFLKKVSRALSVRKNKGPRKAWDLNHATPSDVFSKFMKQALATGVAMLFLTSLAPQTILPTGLTAFAYPDTDYVDLGEQHESPFVETSDGFLLKTSPQNGEVNRLGMTDKVTHTVEAGENLSSISSRYGLKNETIIWENNLVNADSIRLGQTLVIPPVDGVTHKAGASDTLNKIANLYGVDASVIGEHNQLVNGNVIQAGQELFIPGGHKIVPKPPVYAAGIDRNNQARNEGVARNTFDASGSVQASDAGPNEGKPFIFPTSGKVSNGFRGGHYALDIGNRNKPDVWAAAAGTVTTSDGGCAPRGEGGYQSCNSGYGNHIIIDHGNNLQSLYGHCEILYVNVGDHVNQGQAICKMGNTGRVYGATGIHVHWEVIDNGVKRNPVHYY